MPGWDGPRLRRISAPVLAIVMLACCRWAAASAQTAPQSDAVAVEAVRENNCISVIPSVAKRSRGIATSDA
jgi:uncharacterized lipoprotein YajG